MSENNEAGANGIGGIFFKANDPEKWSPFEDNTEYFEPSSKQFIDQQYLDALLDKLRTAGVTIVDEVVIEEYGKFVHIMDPEGNKIELWEPVDEVFTRLYEGKTTR